MAKNNPLDKAFDLFYKKKYKEAGKLFDQAIADEETPSWIKRRLNDYQNIVARHTTEKTDPEPPSLRQVSFLMNNGQFEEAEKALAESDISDGMKAYLRAEMMMEQAKVKEGAKLLQQAIELEPSNTGYALNSPTFAPYLKNEELAFLREKIEKRA